MSDANAPRNEQIHAEVGGLGDIADDVIEERFTRAYPPQIAPEGLALHFAFIKGELVVRENGRLCDTSPVDDTPSNALFVGVLDKTPCLAYTLPGETRIGSEYRTVGLRPLYGTVDEDEFAVAGYAAQLLHFHAHYRFCSKCGDQTQNLPGGWARECVGCKFSVYPPVSPAVLALVHDGGDQILLAQKPGWGTRYSILAGFVEPGESLEGCVVREVLEEAGVLVESPKYQGSQPWPFPHQLMLGFTARFVKGTITPDPSELSDARWFRYDALPPLPPPLSLSRQLIDAWVKERKQANG